MGLVNELQQSAERDDVLTVLRKAKRVSAKLGLKDICEWLDHEQNGYPEDTPVPRYREVSVTICYNTNGYIPAGFGYLRNGLVPLPGVASGRTVPINEPISTVLAQIEFIKSGDRLAYPLTGETEARVRGMFTSSWPFLRQVTFVAEPEGSQVRAIPERIKNRVLDWACELEAAGITGDDQSFSPTEKQAAHTVIFNINNSSIDQLNNSGDNKKGA